RHRLGRDAYLDAAFAARDRLAAEAPAALPCPLGAARRLRPAVLGLAGQQLEGTTAAAARVALIGEPHTRAQRATQNAFAWLAYKVRIRTVDGDSLLHLRDARRRATG